MKTTDYENRKQEIFTSLQEHIPVTHSDMSPEEKLDILQKFADALLTTVFSQKHAQSVTLHNLYYYLQEQSAGLGSARIWIFNMPVVVCFLSSEESNL